LTLELILKLVPESEIGFSVILVLSLALVLVLTLSLTFGLELGFYSLEK